METGKEPMAADLSRKNFRIGLTQLSASLLGVGFDELMQRDLKKARQRVTAITASACVAMLVMGSLTWAAMSARQLAEQRRQDAEGQIEFMITDLKSELESVGRLGPLNAVGQRAVDYYDGYSLAQHDADALGRRARVFHLLGKVQAAQGNLDAASEYFVKAFEASAALLSRNPRQAERLYDHAHSAFWVGYSHYERQAYTDAAPYFQTYQAMIERLALIEGDTPRVERERLHALSNLGAVSTALRDWTRAETYMAEAAQRKLRRLEATPGDLDHRISTANSFTALGALRLRQGNLDGAVVDLETAGSILGAANLPTDDFVLTQQIVVNLRSLANAYILQGDIATAEDYLRDGKALADQLSARESSNVDIGFEQLQLDISAFHLAFMREDSVRAADIYATLRAVIDTAPEAMNDDFRAESVRRLIQPFPLYLAILSDDADRRIEAATALRTNLALPPTTELDADARDDLLLPDLLSQFVLLPDGQAMPTHPLCVSAPDALTVFERSALSTLWSEDVCPAGRLTHSHPHTIFRAAISRLTSTP